MKVYGFSMCGMIDVNLQILYNLKLKEVTKLMKKNLN
jgi:hypothetical protein